MPTTTFALDSATVIHVRAGDALLVLLPGTDATPEEASRLRETLRKELPEVPVVVLAGNVRASTRTEGQ
jgi:hypothetical protein